MTDIAMLSNLLIAFGNTPNAKLGSYAKAELMTIFGELKIDFIDELPEEKV
jgi:hypothetical protein